MGTYQRFRGNSENKLFYLIDDLYGGINTEYSDDASQRGEFRQIVNFDLDKRGCLAKRKGFGKLSALSQIFSELIPSANVPVVKLKSDNYPNPEETNDNIVYMKLLTNDNNCFRNLSAFSGEKAYRKYQEMYGFQNNTFELLIITTNIENSNSTAWRYKVTLPPLIEDSDTETIDVTYEKTVLNVVFPWNRNLVNVDTLEYYNKIYFIQNDRGLVTYDRTAQALGSAFSYSGFYEYDSEHSTYIVTNDAYKPTGLEIRHVGFNVLGGDNTKTPLYWVDSLGLSTDSIQGMFLLTSDNKPVMSVPYDNSFKIAIIYTGTVASTPADTFSIEIKCGTSDTDYSQTVNATFSYDSQLSAAGSLAVYTVSVATIPDNYVQFKITKTGASIDPYYDYYTLGQVDAESKAVEQLSLEDYRMIEFYSRALYYKGNTLWFSDVNNFSYVPNYNYIELPLEPMDEIVKIAFFRNVYVIFTKYKIYKMQGQDFTSTDFSITLLNDSLGCCAGDTVVPIENVLYFASNRGLYMLTSNYSYSTNTSAVTFENVKELDDKVKTLTSNFTYYIGQLDEPAIRYNGISDKAVALRYKDKYMLFYNTSYEEGDYAAENNIDVLSYNYELKAFTTGRFTYKPTFLFTVDNAIETFVTFPDRSTFDDEEDVLEYDFTRNQSGTIEDETGNGYNGKLTGNILCSPGEGVSFSNSNSNITLGTLNTQIDGGLNVEMELDTTNPSSCTILDLSQSNSSSGSVPSRGTITSNTVYSHYTSLGYVATPNRSTGMTDIEYTLKLHRTSLSANLNNTCSYSVRDANGNVLLSANNVTFSFAPGATELVLTTGTISVSGSVDYINTWTLNLSSSYNTTRTEYSGDEKSGSKKVVTTQLSYAYIKYSWAAVPDGEGCELTFSDVALVWSGGLTNNAGKITIKVDGESLTFSMSKNNWATGTGTHTAYSTTSSKSTYIDYTGSHSATIKASYNIAANINGTYYSSISTAEHSISLPKLTQSTYTTTTAIALSGSGEVRITRILDIDGTTTLTYDAVNDRLVFTITSSGNSLVVTSPDNVGFSGDHTWLFKALNSSTFAIYKDGKLVEGTTCTGNLTVTYLLRDINYVGNNKDLSSHFNGEIKTLNIYDNSDTLLSYVFNAGSGNAVYDTANNILATLNNTTWVTNTGCQFNGGYIQIPTLPASIPFENGFIVTVDMKCNNPSDLTAVFDFAKSYDTTNSGNKKCSINGIISNLSYQLESTGASGKRFKIGSRNIDLTERHEYVYSATDNGHGYTIELSVDGTVVLTDSTYSEYNSISNINRESNFIGRSNTPGVGLFNGTLYSFSLKTAKTDHAIVYSPSIFEYDTTYDEFGEPMDIMLETKAYNLAYPQHIKKLKKIFLKLIGGYNYSGLFFEVYCDNLRINNTGSYITSIDSNGSVVYDYVPDENLLIDASDSRLNLVQLNKGRYGEQIYQMRKFAIPAKGKNFSLKFYGKSSDNMELESIGMVCKLGKVKE